MIKIPFELLIQRKINTKINPYNNNNTNNNNSTSEEEYATYIHKIFHNIATNLFLNFNNPEHHGRHITFFNQKYHLNTTH